MRFLVFIKRCAALIILLVICAASFGAMLGASLMESGTMDELAHIPSGYAYVRYFDYRLNPEHPPLVKVLSAIPLLFLNINFPDMHRAWREDVNGQWEMGNQFLYHSDNDANRIIRWARFAPILLTVLLIILIYFWARELMGPMWGLIPAALFGLSPSVLANGHYVTTDIGAALGIVGGTYFFLKFLKHPSQKLLWGAGITFGIAQLLKFSAVLLVPFFVLLTLVYAWKTSGGKEFFRAIFRPLRNTIIVFFIGYALVVYPVYGIFTARYPLEKQVSDTMFILQSFAKGPTPAEELCNPMRCLAELDILMSQNRLARPFGHYLLGVLMVIQRSSGGNTAYFLGNVSAAGSRMYFPIVYLLKESISVLLITMSALVYGLWNMGRTLVRNRRKIIGTLKQYIDSRFDKFTMISFALLYWAYSIQSPLNIGFRHLFPAIPFMYILAVGAWKQWILGETKRIGYDNQRSLYESLTFFLTRLITVSKRGMLLVILFLGLFLETTLAAPYFLSYFNPLGGGTQFGYRYVTDSNYDWGQDLLRLQKFVARNPEIKKIAVDYFGAGDIKYYLADKAEPWWSARGNPLNENIEWLAISINNLQGAVQPTNPGFERRPEDEYAWLTKLRPVLPGFGNVPTPDYRAGTSIFVYKLEK